MDGSRSFHIFQLIQNSKGGLHGLICTVDHPDSVLVQFRLKPTRIALICPSDCIILVDQFTESNIDKVPIELRTENVVSWHKLYTFIQYQENQRVFNKFTSKLGKQECNLCTEFPCLHQKIMAIKLTLYSLRKDKSLRTSISKTWGKHLVCKFDDIESNHTKFSIFSPEDDLNERKPERGWYYNSLVSFVEKPLVGNV